MAKLTKHAVENQELTVVFYAVLDVDEMQDAVMSAIAANLTIVSSTKLDVILPTFLLMMNYRKIYFFDKYLKRVNEFRIYIQEEQ